MNTQTTYCSQVFELGGYDGREWRDYPAGTTPEGVADDAITHARRTGAIGRLRVRVYRGQSGSSFGRTPVYETIVDA